jgi:hypothetical protein
VLWRNSEPQRAPVLVITGYSCVIGTPPRRPKRRSIVLLDSHHKATMRWAPTTITRQVVLGSVAVVVILVVGPC